MGWLRWCFWRFGLAYGDRRVGRTFRAGPDSASGGHGSAACSVRNLGRSFANVPRVRVIGGRSHAHISASVAHRGFAFVTGGVYGILPNSFARPAGWGDVLVGLTAPLAALYLTRPGRARAFVAWQLLGMLDLGIALTTGLLASGIFHPVAGVLTSRELTTLPYSVIPTFAVPVVLIFHFICIWQVARQTAFARERRGGHGVAPTLSPAR